MNHFNAPKRKRTVKQFFVTVVFCTMAVSMLTLVYGLLTLPFWWKAEYFYSTRMAVGVAVFNSVMLGSVILLEKLSPLKDKP